jgi:hypothetical protein
MTRMMARVMESDTHSDDDSDGYGDWDSSLATLRPCRIEAGRRVLGPQHRPDLTGGERQGEREAETETEATVSHSPWRLRLHQSAGSG